MGIDGRKIKEWWSRSGLSGLEGIVLSILAALVSTIVVGYRFGDSNHGITVPILKRLIDPSLYPGDVMVATAERFPTIFYRTLAALLPDTQAIPLAFFVLYVLSIAATYGAVYRIGRFFGGPTVGFLAAAIVFPVRVGLAGEALYRVAFSHSHVSSAMTLWAIAWFLEGRRITPLLLLSLGVYNHLLYSLYVLAPMLLIVCWEGRSVGWRKALLQIASGVLPILPLGVWMMGQQAPLTAEWLELLRLRSAHHSFPSAFGGDLPTAAALLALAALAAARLSGDKRTLLAGFLLGISLQFVVGTMFTEMWPIKAVLQYQPHRAWRFLMVILQAVIATGIVEQFRAGGYRRFVAIVTGAILFHPGLEVLFPVVLVLQVLASDVLWARLMAILTLVSVPNWGEREIDFLPLLGDYLRRLPTGLVLNACALALLIYLGRKQGGRWRVALTATAALALVFWYGPDVSARARVRWQSASDHWRLAQEWARDNTSKGSVYLTPPKLTGFRVFSERTVIGEWKDGTQQYFDPQFASEWGTRMEVLAGDRFPRLADEQLIEISARYGATHIVLPTRPLRKQLILAYKNPSFAIYRAKLNSPSQ
ncbi:MAG: hypothetical protein MUF51_08295 [Vicinamibacteria bacterium]|jgi:hypothetical protein|nr:hypothetical protein [Vicinamibacteria bacterium]